MRTTREPAPDRPAPSADYVAVYTRGRHPAPHAFIQRAVSIEEARRLAQTRCSYSGWNLLRVDRLTR